MEQMDTDATTRSPRRVMHKADVVQKRMINRMLEDPNVLVIEPTIPEGYKVPRGRYQPGWSDERVAKEAGVTAKNVTSIRVRAFCSLIMPSGADRKQQGSRAELEERLTALVKSEIAAVLELLGPGQGGGGVSEERLQLILDRVNGLDDRMTTLDNRTKAQISAVNTELARVRSEVRR